MSRTERSPYHHGQLASALVAVARDAVNAEGPEAISLREVARRLDVSPTAAYRHFADKESLLAAVAALGFRVFADQLRSALARARGFAAMGEAYVALALAEPGLFRLMFGPLFQLKERHASLEAGTDSAFAVLLQGARTVALVEADVEDIAHAAWAFSHGLARLALDGVISRERAASVSRVSHFGSRGEAAAPLRRAGC